MSESKKDESNAPGNEFTRIFELMLRLSDPNTKKGTEDYKKDLSELYSKLNNMGIDNQIYISNVLLTCAKDLQNNEQPESIANKFAVFIRNVEAFLNDEEKIQQFHVAFLAFIDEACKGWPEDRKEKFKNKIFNELIIVSPSFRSLPSSASLIKADAKPVDMKNMTSAAMHVQFQGKAFFSASNYTEYTLSPFQAVAVLVSDFDAVLNKCSTLEQLETLTNEYPKHASCIYLNQTLTKSSENKLPPILKERVDAAKKGIECIEQFKTALQAAESSAEVNKLYEQLIANKDYQSYVKFDRLHVPNDPGNKGAEPYKLYNERLEKLTSNEQSTKQNIKKYGAVDSQGSNSNSDSSRYKNAKAAFDKLTGRTKSHDSEADSLLKGSDKHKFNP